MKHATDRRTEESSAEAHLYIVRYLHFMIKVPGAVSMHTLYSSMSGTA